MSLWSFYLVLKRKKKCNQNSLNILAYPFYATHRGWYIFDCVKALVKNVQKLIFHDWFVNKFCQTTNTVLAEGSTNVRIHGAI